jgi:hypothetical protein
VTSGRTLKIYPGDRAKAGIKPELSPQPLSPPDLKDWRILVDSSKMDDHRDLIEWIPSKRLHDTITWQLSLSQNDTAQYYRKAGVLWVKCLKTVLKREAGACSSSLCMSPAF